MPLPTASEVVYEETTTTPPPLPPPEQQQAAPPPQVAPPATGLPTADQVVYEGQAQPAPQAPAPEQQAPAPGPVEQAANAAGGFLQEHVAAPVSQYVPQGVKEEVGPRASGAVGALGAVGQGLGQAADAAMRLDPGGAAGALISTSMLGGIHQTEEQGRAARQKETVGLGDVRDDPSVLSALIGTAYNDPSRIEPLIKDNPLPQGVQDVLNYDPVAAIANAIGVETPLSPTDYLVGGGQRRFGSSLSDFAAANPDIPDEQLYEAWKAAGGAENTPAGIENFLDEEGNAVGKAKAIPEFVGSVKDSASQGRLRPFLAAQEADLVNDPTLPAQLLLGIASSGASLGARTAGRLGLGGLERGLGGLGGATRAANRAADLALDPTAPAREVLAPAARGLKNLGGLTDKSATSRAQQLANQDYELATRYLPELREGPPPTSAAPPSPATPAPPPTASNTLFNPPERARPARQVTNARPDPYLRETGPQPTTKASSPTSGEPLTAEPINIRPRRVTIDEDLAERVRRGEMTPQEAVNAQMQRPRRPPPEFTTGSVPRDALEVRQGRWRTQDGQSIVTNGDIDPALRTPTRRAYDEMLTAEPEAFWDRFDSAGPTADVPAGADGYYARWRAAMRQGTYLVDDWPERRVLAQFPQARNAQGGIDWQQVGELATAGDANARRAMGGKRAHDLYVHRIAAAAEPDREVYNLVATYHLDQMSGRFSGSQYGADYWKQRAEALEDVLRDAGYTPSPALLGRLSTTSLKNLAESDFPTAAGGISAQKMLSQGGMITLHRPGGVTAIAPQPRAPQVTPEPDLTSNTSYGGLSIAQRQRAQATLPEMRAMGGRQAEVSPTHVVALDDVRAFHFANGNKESLPLGTMIDKLQREAEEWIDLARDPALQTGRAAGRWESLSKKFGDGIYDPTTLTPQMADELVALRLTEAGQKALAPTKKATDAGVLKTYQDLLNFNRGVRLFNILNVPRYILQNHFGNTIINLAAGRPRAAVKLFTRLSDIPGTYRHLQNPAKHSNVAEDLMRATGEGVDRSVTQTNRAMLQLDTGGRPQQGRIANILMPEWQKNLAQTVDTNHRSGLYGETLQAGYHRLNADLSRGVKEWSAKYGLPYSDAQIDEVVGEFLDGRRALIDATTGDPHTGLLGRADRYEPVWSSKEFNNHLRQKLTAIARPVSSVTDDPMGLLLRRVGADNTAAIRAIREHARAMMNRVAFDWLATNLDEAMQNVFVYHFWNSRAGLLYAKQGMKNPAMLAAYGRIMEDFQTQLDLHDGPDWLKGWFQFLNTPAGYSIWFSPFDLVGSMLTFADWQMDSGENPFDDLTALGRKRDQSLWLINPLLDFLVYSSGGYGSDARPPDVLGVNRMWGLGTSLLNEANFEGMLPFANALGIGVDKQGNRVPLKLKPLDELVARIGNGISTALKPFTGLRPVTIPNTDASAQRTDQLFLDQNLRLANPGMEESEIQKLITQAMMDPGSPEMQEAFGQRVDLPLMIGGLPGGGELPGPIQAALRLASPIGIYAASEQQMRGGTLKALPAYQAATIPPPVGDSYPSNNSRTLEARKLDEQVYGEKPSGGDPVMDDIARTGSSIWYGDPKETLTIGGVDYTPEHIAAMSEEQRGDLQDQYYLDQGTDWRAVDNYRDTIPKNADINPEGQAYWDWKNAAEDYPGGETAYVNDLIASNPAYADYIQRNAYDLSTGVVKYKYALSTDAYLASQGVRPTVWEPISAPSGMLPGDTPPPLPNVVGDMDLELYGETEGAPGVPAQAIAGVAAGTPMKLVSMEGDWARVQVGGQMGLIDSAYLTNEPGGGAGLIGALGGLVEGTKGIVGSLIDNTGAVVGSMVGDGQAAGEGFKPSQTPFTPGMYAVEAAPDGLGVKSTADSDRMWMERMIGDGHAIVTTDYKGSTPAGVSYEYQNGHAADGTTHAAYDISCDTGYRSDGTSTCPGTPIYAPISGTVVCSGYGQGTGKALVSCTYSQNTTHPTNERGEPSAHTVVLDAGSDAEGNPLQLSFNHMGSSALQPGQTVKPGDLLGGMGDTDGGPHVHLEGWGWCASENTYHILDPALIVNGYYQTNPVC